MKSRLTAPALVVGGIVAALIGMCAFKPPHLACDYLIGDVVASAGDEQPTGIQARLGTTADRGLLAITRISARARRFAIGLALERAQRDSSAEAQHAGGVAALLSGAYAEAESRLAHAARRDTNNSALWLHLGAAQYELAVRTHNDEIVLSSLGASSHALFLQPDLDTAAYNFALAVERLGVTPAAIESWRALLAHVDKESWKSDAQQRFDALSRATLKSGGWQERVRQAASHPPALAAFTRSHPQQARLWTEVETLPEWAKASQRGAAHDATRHLDRARLVAETLYDTTGESLLREAVKAIDLASRAHDHRGLQALIAAHVEYTEGRRLYRDENLRAATLALDQAASHFAAANSPMSSVAAAYAASTLHDSDQLGESYRRVMALLAQESAHKTHYVLRAQLHYQLARTHALRGEWSDCLVQSHQAQRLYARTREHGNNALGTLLVAEAYDFLGQPTLAVRHGIDGIRLLAREGDTYRLRVAVANLCRASMRRGQWDTARGLVQVERTLEPLSPDLSMTIDSHMRTAVIHEKFGATALAERELAIAAAKAQAAPDEALRASLLADIHGAHGAMLRRRNPSAAIEFLDRAISYQERTERALLLPHLYLERGRAKLALQKRNAALEDLESGISHLERQRSNVNDTAMRYGMFDDAHELFTDAVDLHVRSGDIAAAFSAVERGRARTLLEQIAGTHDDRVAPPDAEAVRRAMPPRTLLIEYAALRERLLIFIIATDRFEMREVAVTSTALADKTSAFIAALAQRRSIETVYALASDLHSTLLGAIPEYRLYDHLVIVPDTIVQQIPFAALYDRTRRQWLIEQHVLVTEPSAAVFLAGRARVQPQSRSAVSAAIFVGSQTHPTLALRALPEAAREAESVAQRYPNVAVHRGPDASTARFLAEAGRYDVVHFAGHALIDAADPSQSALVLSSSDPYDVGLLRCRQIGKSHFPKPRVVVLAACSTMRGRTGRTEGTPSIARSFLAAGVPTVVGTLWDIEDGDTASLISDFHTALAHGETPARALRHAQSEAIQSPHTNVNHPGSWAAFALLGAGGV